MVGRHYRPYLHHPQHHQMGQLDVSQLLTNPDAVLDPYLAKLQNEGIKIAIVFAAVLVTVNFVMFRAEGNRIVKKVKRG